MEKIMNGYNNGLFMPDQSITREEVAKVIYLISNARSEKGVEIQFKDVLKDRWSYEYISKLSELEIFKGYEDGSFKPYSPIKRSEIVTILCRIYK